MKKNIGYCVAHFWAILLCFMYFPMTARTQGMKMTSQQSALLPKETSDAVVYLYDLESRGRLISKDNSTIVDDTVQSVRLPLQQFKSLLTTWLKDIPPPLPDMTTIGNHKKRRVKETKCFIPHHGIVFYGKNSEMVAHLSVCFECNKWQLVVRNTDGGWSQKKVTLEMEALKNCILSLGIPVFATHQEYRNYSR
ncbi:MAG: hypothetical protein EAZ92_00590 [Candidatus Kapaibacterium sp.]|nr:MAG: hypothetical protein EAZ92_00590 [Candidatus Kapabacteria bacterium]